MAWWLTAAALAGLAGCPVEAPAPNRPQAAVAPIRDLDRESLAAGEHATPDGGATAAPPAEESAATPSPLGPGAGLPNASNPLRLADPPAAGEPVLDVAQGEGVAAAAEDTNIDAGETAKAAPATPAEPLAKAPRAPAEARSAPESAPAAQPDTGGAPRAAQPDNAPAKPRRKFDPIEINGKFFVGWTKPKLALVVTGRQDGYLEPCGCAGLDRQKGGLSRRYTFLKELAARGWPVAAVDVGSQVRRFGKQAELQFAISAEALRAMHYVAVGLGSSDLRLSAGEIAAAIAGDKPEQNNFVSANVDVFGFVPQVRIVQASGLKLGITAVLGDEYRQQVNNTEVTMRPAADVLAGALDELKGCDVKILLANATLEETEVLAKKFPGFNVVVTGGGPDEPDRELKKVEGTQTSLIGVGHKGMVAIVLGFYDDPRQPLRYQVVELDSRFAASPEMTSLKSTYQSQLQALEWSGLGLRPAAHSRSKVDGELGGKFVGSAACQDCHADAFAVWKNSKHAHATQTLADLRPPRLHDAECVSCHVTGWNPQEFFPYKTGFESLQKTPQLADNGCENCHGPGAAHVAAEQGQDARLQGEWRKLMHLDKATADEQSCSKCHDLDNSIDFDFKKYWSEIAH